MEAPRPKKINKILTAHGHQRVDEYYWMRDRENQEVVDYLNKENEYTQASLSATEGLQKTLYDEIVGRIKQDDKSVPVLYDGYYYYTRYEEGKEYAINCRKKGSLEAEEEVLLDQNQMAKGHDYYSLGDWEVSTNNQLIAFSEDTVGRRNYDIRIKDLQTGEVFEDLIPATAGSITWANDNKTIFYTLKDDALRAYRTYRHVLGTPQEEDVLVFEEEDGLYDTFIYKTKSKKYLIIGSTSTTSSEFQILEAENPTGEFRMFQARTPLLEYGIDHFEDHFYIRTNMAAHNFRLMKCTETATTFHDWVEVIPHREDVLLEDIEIFRDYLVVTERKDGLIHLNVKRWDETEDYYIPFDEPAYVAYTGANMDFDTNILRFGYASMTRPNSVFDFNMADRSKELKKEQEIVGGYSADDYVCERVNFPSHDGVMVPMSIVYKKGLKKEGGNPTLLYGYGSYGYSIDPHFSSVRLSLLDRGFVYAIAHIRGSETLGRSWYEHGKFLKKKNTFLDFIAAAEWLTAENYTNKDKLAMMGGSAGGLLMGAVMNMRPDLFKAVIAAVPFVDVVTTMLDESIPLTIGEYEEWGNPNDKTYYDYMLSYSPYDNVVAQDYPSVLVTSGFHDSQVQYWEPTKWVAKLRELKTDNNRVLLHTNMDAGHGGQSGRFRKFKETALEYAFLIEELGVNY
ncbi:S9 family peptidase [Persicobacter psychrovividus]|uniref:Oligopeptidase B n=1 Tax=Persicobacter psychrovividus TaxID=387638 RepID=A0ABM7VBY4_9BACT|nr:oligopeptidase B [Persicobacter psychrovividus]